MKKRYSAYIRVSTVKQGERGSSLNEQRSAIEAYAARNGLTIGTWFEEMETAAKQGRREFSRLLTQLRSGKADGLIIHKIDRSARNLRDWAELGDLIDRGVDVRFVSDNFDLLSRGGRLSADIQAVVAADYIRNLRDEVKKGMYGRLKQGIYPFAAPMGYLNTGKAKAKAIDPLKGPLIRALFERYGTNTVSFEELRHEFARKGLRTRMGKPLAANSLTNILNNPFYMGVIRIGTTGETFAGAHEPLISGALFNSVHAILRGKTVPKAKKHRFLFRQMIRCGTCQRRTLTAEMQKGVAYYRCHTRACRGATWRGDVLERLVAERLACISLSAGDMGRLGTYIKEICRSQSEDAEHHNASLKLLLDQIEGRLTKLTDLLLDGTVDKATYNTRRERLLMERQELTAALQQAREIPPLEGVHQMFERNNTALLRYKLLLDDEKRELVDIVCSNFSVSGENLVFTLRNPYCEIEKIDHSSQGALQRDDVRTRRLADILKSISDNAVSHPHVPSSPGAGFRNGKGDFPEALAA